MKHGNMRRFLPLLAAVTLLVGLFAAGCTSANKEVVATCGGDPVLREEYSFLAGKLADADLGEEEIREKIAPSIIEDRAILAAGADLLDGLTVDDKAVKAAVRAGMKEAIAEYGGKDAYRAALAERSLTDIFALARAYRIPCLEFRGIGGIIDNREIPDFAPDRLAQTRAALDRAGLTARVIGASASFHDPREREASLAEAHTAVQIASALGAPPRKA